MKMLRITNKDRIKRILHSRRNLHATFKKLYWLEFENESILKFLAKYDIIMSKNGYSERIPTEIKTKEFIDVTVEEEFPLIM